MKTRRFTLRGRALVMYGAALVSLLLFGGCAKEEGAMRFSLFTEAYSGGAKVVVDGLTSSWRAGDHVIVNGVEGAVGVDGEGTPYLDVDVTRWGMGYYAAYPASAVERCTQNGLLTLTLPQEYQYREDDQGHQLLEMPMVAYSEDDRLVFKHLTGALVVKVPHVNRDIVLDYIMVKSSTSPLSGRGGTVDMNADSLQVTFGSDTTHTVVMYFDRCPVTIPSNADTTKDIMIPIAPTTGDGHKFTVTVFAHAVNYANTYYIFNQKSTEGNMQRNMVAVAKVTFPSSQGIPFLGSGNEPSPYLIQTKVDYKNFLYWISASHDNDRWYSLVNDINFGGDTVTAVTSEPGFYGHFNGNGKRLSNVAVIGSTYSYLTTNNHYLSLFPAMNGGWVKNVSLSEIKLIPPQSSSFANVYVGGFSSYVRSFSQGVFLENIHVSNVEYVYSGISLSVTQMIVGGIVGYLSEATNSGYLSMQSCEFIQSEPTMAKISLSTNTLCVGGLIGDALTTDMTLTDCLANFGGTQNVMGTTVRTDASTNTYVGAAIGRSTSNTVQMVNPLLLKGYMLFIGNANSNVKKVIGNYSNVTIQGSANTENLHLYRRSYSDSQNTAVTADY